MPKEEKSHLLIIEDDEDLGEVVRDYFKSRGFNVDLCFDALGPLSRLRKLEGQASPWDIILTDLKIPGVNGIEFIKELRTLAPSTPVILMTAHGGVETAVLAVREGAYDFVMKPLKFPELTVTIERGLELKKLQEDNVSLRALIKGDASAGIVAKSAAMKTVLDLAKRVSNSTTTVLINGESGCGKEVVARAIHEMGNRSEKPFVAINCAAIPETLLESELFGFAKGSFTGALEKKLGLFEEAEGGTLFLDEIGDLGGALQAKLLRVLQERKIKRIGENSPRPIDVRVIAATHRVLVEEVREGRFREDLFFRLNVIPIRIAPLRERREDILPLAEFFLKKFRAANEGCVRGFSKAAMDDLIRKSWRGNVRELENTIERAVVLCPRELIEPSDLVTVSELDEGSPSVSPAASPAEAKAPEVRSPALPEGSFVGVSDSLADQDLPTLNDLGLQYIRWVVDRVGGVKEKARRILDIDRKTLAKKIEQFEEESGEAPIDGDGQLAH